MNNEKIGRLIAQLRKNKGLTQQDLGDKVGVGFRAVSKWERGLTLPDISIINELSNILGISSDELLKGELKEKEITKTKIKKIFILSILVFLLTISITFLILTYQNKSYTYEISSTNYEYRIDGKVILEKDNINITINKIHLDDKELRNKKILNYSYKVKINDELIIGYGFHPSSVFLEEENTIEKITNNFRINHNSKINQELNQIKNGELIIEFIFIDEENNVIKRSINCKLK